MTTEEVLAQRERIEIERKHMNDPKKEAVDKFKKKPYYSRFMKTSEVDKG